jgi:hypothetical protein
MTRKTAAALLFLLLTTPAFGLEWQAIPASTTQAHFDPDYIRCESHFCRVRMKSVHPQDALANYLRGNPKYENYGWSISEWGVDCKNNKSGIVNIVDYSVYDRIIDNGVYQFSYRPNIPDSEEAIRWEAICGHIKSLDLYKRWYE